ncbi:hypothetical protein BGZ65_010554 [Modicella reniformis]|uniref:Uncharacterized protein n=1 Tax=Modicella reniformis TaxID=1440133 RepID=A0A9P6M1S6_9FUNG|nr:hypothetical protein BGZ65_010554 [Modicella reniformis]
MNIFTFFIFLVMSAMLSSAFAAESGLEIRAVKKPIVDTPFDRTLDLFGIIDADFGFASKVSTALSSSIKATVKAQVEAEITTQFTSTLRPNLASIMKKRCPDQGASCIKLQAKNIVNDATKRTTKGTSMIANKIAAKLAVNIKRDIDLEVEKFSIDLWFIKITVSGDLDVSNSVLLRFKGAAGISAKKTVEITAKEVSMIRTICS